MEPSNGTRMSDIHDSGAVDRLLIGAHDEEAVEPPPANPPTNRAHRRQEGVHHG
jgi:hypothetical protein